MIQRVFRSTSLLLATVTAINCPSGSAFCEAEDGYTVTQLTSGPSHHLFGYIGHCGTIPWNGSGRYVLALRAPFQNRMPGLNDPAEIVLLDTHSHYAAQAVDVTRGWNLQQGSMMYWNPEAPETQFFFNDRDAKTGILLTVLYDIERRERVREYRFPDFPVANSGVAQTGGSFLALNYGRLTRLRLVTGYAELDDWSQGENAPENDGIFKIDVATGRRNLLVSYRTLRDKLRDDFPKIDDYALFINHTLWNRPSNRIYFFVRANFRSPSAKVDIPFTIDADGKNLTRHDYCGGHPEWDRDNILIGSNEGRQIRYDTSSKTIVGTIGQPETFPDPGGDIALSPNQQWLINGHKRRELKQTFFTFINLTDDRVIQTRGFPIGPWLSGELRIDPAPCWNRESHQVLFGGYDETSETRQLFLLKLTRP